MPSRERLQLLSDTASLLSRKWTLPIVKALSQNTKRHSELRRELAGITQKVLTETLREMERSGIIERTIYPTIPPQVEYKLTPIGVGLVKLSRTFSEWFDLHQEHIHHSQTIYDRHSKV